MLVLILDSASFLSFFSEIEEKRETVSYTTSTKHPISSEGLDEGPAETDPTQPMFLDSDHRTIQISENS